MEYKPKITVLMSTYNNEEYLHESIDSVLCQTFPDFEFIIIDDGSTDSTKDIIKGYSDDRIRYIKNNKNIGLTRSLNKGLDFAKGEFIARHDSDDKMEKNRLEKQIDFLKNNLDVAVVGSQWITIDEYGDEIGRIPWPIGYENNLFKILTGDNPVSTALFRIEIIKGLRYSNKFAQSQDWDLYLRIYAKSYKSDNIPRFLNFVRVHKGQISETLKNQQRKNHNLAFYDFYKEVTKNEIAYSRIEEYLNALIWKSEKIRKENVESIIDIFWDLFYNFKSMHKCNDDLIYRFLKRTIYNYDNLFCPSFLYIIIKKTKKYNLSVIRTLFIIVKLLLKKLILRFEKSC